jgi:hypothetical protein
MVPTREGEAVNPGGQGDVEAGGSVSQKGGIDVAQTHFDVFGQAKGREGVDTFGGVVALRELEVNARGATEGRVTRGAANGKGFEGDTR